MIDWDRNLFQSDPTLLRRSDDDAYERAAHLAESLTDPRRLKLLHALTVGEDTAQRAAVWSGLDQPFVERELAAMTLAGILERREDGPRPVYAPRDGHLVVALHLALAHGGELVGERHPRLLKPRRIGRTRERRERKVG